MTQYIKLKQTKQTGNTTLEYLSISLGLTPNNLFGFFGPKCCPPVCCWPLILALSPSGPIVDSFVCWCRLCKLIGDDELVWLQCGPNNPVEAAGIGGGGGTIAVHGADIVKLGVPLIGLSGGRWAEYDDLAEKLFLAAHSGPDKMGVARFKRISWRPYAFKINYISIFKKRIYNKMNNILVDMMVDNSWMDDVQYEAYQSLHNDLIYLMFDVSVTKKNGE